MAKSLTSADGLLAWKPEGRYPALWKLLIEWGTITPDGQRVESSPPNLQIVEAKKVTDQKPFDEMSNEEYHHAIIEALKTWYKSTIPMPDGAIDTLVKYLNVLFDECCDLDKRLIELQGNILPRSGETRLLQLVSPKGKQYTRKQPLVMREWQCCVCGQHHSQAVLPGQAPKYCPPSDGDRYSPCQRLARTSAVKRYRTAKKSA